MMKNQIAKIGILIFALSALSACNEKITKALPDEGGAVPFSNCGPAEFSLIQSVILTTRCNTCHDRHLSKGIDLSNYAGVKASLGKVETVLRARTMPEARPLPRAEEELILKWISDGAPETVPAEAKKVCDENEPGLKPQPLLPNYESLKDKVFEGKCLKCHQAGGDAELYDFASYNGMMFSSELFDQVEPAASIIIKSITKEGRGSMPPTRSGIARVTPEEVQVIIEWIRLGMPEKAPAAASAK